MLTLAVNNSLSSNEPRYTQVNLWLLFFQEIRDIQISRKPIQLSHNHENCRTHQNHAH